MSDVVAKLEDQVLPEIESQIRPGAVLHTVVTLLPEELAALKAVLERESTSRPSHDGLRGLLSLSPAHADALLGLLRRI